MDLRDQLQSTLDTSYTIERELGGGGMSRVFVATETALGRKVVVKVLSPELTAGVNIDRFRREILVAAQLQHPHIVPVLSTGETDGLPYYTMPFVEGESVRARLARGPLSITEAVSILRDLARALAYAHERGVVHRDIKPDNVLLSGGSATVTDFGIAKAISASRTQAPGATLTQVGTSLGTPAYMSPEQAAADPATDHRADIYAFGCMAYELLAGRPPFVEKTPQRLLAAHMGETPQPIEQLRIDTPPALADLVMRCLAKDAAARPQTAGDLVRVLESVTSSDAHAAMPPALLGGAGMLRRALATWAGALVVVAIVAKAA
ncbi:MAG: serine/threonine-protein kinase, partial [Deltaproteobacteria bacterium]